ncbi:MAG TPA: pyridoxine 5'-phosphate synthase, partial [Acidobacteria bacterium]|nr:pyridoxine 5'-phosphate synthase [Acidobacteriota bacterium]
ATARMLEIARRHRPDLVTLVPEREGEVTTEGGIDAARLRRRLSRHITALRRSRIAVSLFIDPQIEQIEAAAALGVGMVELNTNAYASAGSDRARARAYDAFVAAAARAEELGLQVAAGHGLTVRNVAPIADVPQVFELNIGHSIIARSIFLGLGEAVAEMLDAIGA